MDDIEQIKIWTQKTLGQIAESTVFLGLCTENFAKDPICLMQFALSVLLDKPLFLLIEKGVNIGKNLTGILEGYEFYEPDNDESRKQATEKLTKRIDKFLNVN